MAAAALLLAAFVAPALADKGTDLSSATVSPRWGKTSTTIVITVSYSSRTGSEATSVTAKVGSVDHTMVQQHGGTWKAGVIFKWSGTLPLGPHEIVISTHARNGGGDQVNAGAVWIGAASGPDPTPAPTPKPSSTPPPTPKPSPLPTSAPTPTRAPTPTSTPSPTSRPTSRPTPAATPRATPRATSTAVAVGAPPPEPTATSTAEASPAPTSAPTPTPSPTPSSSTEPLLIAAAIGATGPGAPGPAGSSPDATAGRTDPADGAHLHGGPLSSLLAIAGLTAPVFPEMSIGPTLVTTTGGVATAMAFGLFGRRRRDRDPSDDILAAGAATGIGVVPLELAGGTSTGPANVEEALHTPEVLAAVAVPIVAADDLEAQMPRWRRPSLILARHANPMGDNGPTAHLTFDHDLVLSLDGPERRVIRYRVVRLLDTPDELRGMEIGFLDQGDEVELIEKYGAYWQVLSPDGQQGWLHKMTLGEIVDDERPAEERPVATMPIDAETWTMAEDDVDPDVLDAYLASRRRRPG